MQFSELQVSGSSSHTLSKQVTMATRVDPVVGELQARAQEWQTRFSSALGLGVRK